MAPPFLTYVRELSMLQVWTGQFVETAEDWSALVRPPANLPRHQAYEQFEGLIETDRWFGPLITNVRLLRRDVPIRFSSEAPLVQVQPVHRQTYGQEPATAFGLEQGLGAFAPRTWSRYEDSIVRPNRDPERRVGGYAVAVRKRRKAECPFGHARRDTRAVEA